jgi:hypothetical protein
MPGLSAPEVTPQRSATADQLSQAGVGLMRAGIGVSFVAARAKADYDEGRVSELETRYADGAYNALRGDRGYLNLVGSPAADPAKRTEYLAGLDRAAETLIDATDSPEQRQALTARLHARGMRARELIDSHHYDQSRVFAIGQEAGRISRAQTDYVANFDSANPAVARDDYNRAVASTTRFAEMKGLPVEDAVAGVKAAMHAGMLDRLIREERVDEAQAYYRDNRGGLDADARGKIEGVLGEASARKRGTDLAFEFEAQNLSPLDQLAKLDSMRGGTGTGAGPALPNTLTDREYRKALAAVIDRQQVKAELAARETVSFQADVFGRLDANRQAALSGQGSTPGVPAALLDVESLLSPTETERARRLGVLDNLRTYAEHGRFGDVPGGREAAARLMQDGIMRELSWEQIHARVRPWVSDSTMSDLFQGWNKARGTRAPNPDAKGDWESDRAFVNTETDRMLKFLPADAQAGRFSEQAGERAAFDFRRDEVFTMVKDRFLKVREKDTTTPERDLVRQIVSAFVEEKLQAAGGGSPSDKVNAAGATIFAFTNAENVNSFQVVEAGVAVPLSELADPATMRMARGHALAAAAQERLEAEKWKPQDPTATLDRRYVEHMARADRYEAAANENNLNLPTLARVLASVRAIEGPQRALKAKADEEMPSLVKSLEARAQAEEQATVTQMMQRGAKFGEVARYVYETRYGWEPNGLPYEAERLRLIRQDLWATFPEAGLPARLYQIGEGDSYQPPARPPYSLPAYPSVEDRDRFWQTAPFVRGDSDAARQRDAAAERRMRWR